MNEPEKQSLKRINDDIARALSNCANTLSINELSRVTGVRIELLRRFINRTARDARAETWDKIYPTLKPLLEGPAEEEKMPVRIGPAYRRHHDLVAMTSDQKVLLDEYAIFSENARQRILRNFCAAAGEFTPCTCKSLSADENKLMGAFLALAPDKAESMLLELTARATDEVRKQRKELF